MLSGTAIAWRAGLAKSDADDGEQDADREPQADQRVDRVGGILPAAGPVELGDDDAAAGGEAGKKADQQVDQLAGGAADRRQRLLADEVADDNRVTVL